MQQYILQALHSSAIGGHSGFHATYNRVKHLFSWPGLKMHVKEFVSTCSICQQAKAERVPYPGLLEPLEVPARASQVITMDFITCLPVSAGISCILVVVDKFSKYAHFLPLAHPFTAFSVAMVLMKEVYRLHSMPEAILSDRSCVYK